MSENFAELFETSQASKQMRPGDLLKATVVNIDNDFVTVSAGLKSEAVVPASQFYENGQLAVQVGDNVEVVVESVDNGLGETRLSREKAKRAEAWARLEKAHEADEITMGTITGRVRGGFTVEIDTVRAFLPGSLADSRPIRDPASLEGKEYEFKVIKIDAKRNNIVVSRRSVLESENSAERENLLATLVEDQEVKGIVKNLTDYGAFVDLGGIDGLLHITDMSWKRVKHPSEVISVGEEITVKVLKFDRERSRVSLGLKQLGKDPWADLQERYPENSTLTGRVTNLTDYGCFVEIEEGIEGLVHVSEMDWTNKNIHPSKVVQVGDEVEVMVLEVDADRRRISLGVKQCKVNPWKAFAENHKEGEKISGKIKSITDFGIFIGLEGNIDGLVHLSDISWTASGEKAIRQYKKGSELEALILSIDSERERISLGVKQLEEDSFMQYAEANNKGSIVTGKVTEVTDKGVTVELAPEVTGYIKKSDLAVEKIENPADIAKEGDEIEAKCIAVDKKNRVIGLSIKALSDPDSVDYSSQDEPEESEANAKLSELLKQKMEEKQD